jgi:DNA primase
MPEGTDPADLVAQEGSEAFGERMERAVPMIEFQVRRVLADADLDTPAGRDKALGEARELISAVPERTATRDALVREAADRLDVPVDHVLAPARAPAARTYAPTQASPGELALRTEREFLIRCLSSADLGHDFLSKPDDEQFSSELTRRARVHFVSEFDDPVATVPQDDPRLAALVTDLAFAAQERPPTDERTLEFSLLQLELRRIQREIRRAAQDGELGRQSELAAAEQSVRKEMGSISIGQTA